VGRFDYAVYGLRLRANRALPHLPPARDPSTTGSADLQLELSNDLPGLATPEATVLRYANTEDAVEFVISADGTQIWSDWSEASPVATIDDFTGLLIGRVLGTALRLRGTISLHGAAIMIGTPAVAIVADRDVGKSTLAGALAATGYAVMSDDVVAITEESAGWTVHPGYPRLRLKPLAIEALELVAPALDRVFTGQEKRYLPLSESTGTRFQREPAPIGAIYELARSSALDSPRIEPVEGADRLATLLRHRSAGHIQVPRARQAQELRSLGALSSSVPVRRIVTPDGLQYVSASCSALCNDLAALA
jgi:hypothetical protein